MYIDSSSAVIISASDLATYAACEFAFLRRLDAKLGRIRAVVDEIDALGQKTITLGLAHEKAVLDRYRADGLKVVELGAEGDPLYSEQTTVGDETRWGPAYLFRFPTRRAPSPHTSRTPSAKTGWRRSTFLRVSRRPAASTARRLLGASGCRVPSIE